jgi:ParB-like chromosome segregation protein Spo0J
MAARKPKNQLKKLGERLETLSLEWLTLDQLKANPWNPNRQSEHEFQMLCASITDAGFTQPIMVTEVDLQHGEEWAPEIKSGRFALGDLVIVDGEHRWRAAKQLGIDPVPVVRMPYGAMQARLSTLQMNRARGTEDVELATDVLRDLETLGVLDWAAQSLDLNDAELQTLLADTPPPEALAGEEFSEAWHPGGVRVDDKVYDDGRAVSHHTPTAMRSDREYQERVLKARSEIERQQVRDSRRTFQLILRFAGDEADLVRATVGDEPAVWILERCKEVVVA